VRPKGSTGLIAWTGAATGVALIAHAGALHLPDDPFFQKQWSLNNDGSHTVMIDQDDLHSVAQKGSPGADIGWLQAKDLISPLTPTPVTVAVIDSGIDPKHPDLQGRILTDGWDFLKNSPQLLDDTGHGTHVSGIIAANAGNAVGIAGIAPAPVKILPLRILARSFTNFAFNGRLISDYAADAIRYATAHGASVINMSFGWPKVVNTDNVRNAVREAVQKGVLIVAAAGNDRKDQPTYPCAFEGVLCVGAVSNNGAMALYSNSGGIVDLLGPGDGIISLFPGTVESSTLRIQGYEMMSGTSQAAPHVAGLAAALKSLMPNLTTAELKARLIASSAALPVAGSALYGLPHLKRAIELQPSPLFLPNFKTIEEIAIDETSLRAQGLIGVQNLWREASSVRASITINEKPAGSFQLDTLPSGGRFTIPWTYQFASLEDSSDLRLVLSVEASGVAPRAFTLHASAARSIPSIAGTQVIPLPAMDSWIGANNGHLFSRLSPVVSLPPETGLPRYYQQLGSDETGAILQILDPSDIKRVVEIKAPAIQRITQVMRFDATGTGRMAWLITGMGNDHGRIFFEFYFLDPNFKPLWGSEATSTWQIGLDNSLSDAIVRNYAAPGSWIRSEGRLLPCFVVPGFLPELDAFDRLDPRRYKPENHLYYLTPQTVGPTAVQLQLRALDSAAFRKKNPGLRISNLVPTGAPGSLRLLLKDGESLSAKTSLWDIRSLTSHSIRNAQGWSPLSSAGNPMQALSIDPASGPPIFLSFFDPARGSIAWADPDGGFQGSTEFTYKKPQNGFAGLIGAFNLPEIGRFWFVESRFDLVAFHEQVSPSGSAVLSQTLPIERDSTFPGQHFSEMLSPVVVGDTKHPLPGVYIDSTLVRGNRVAVAVWNPSSQRLEKTLRYSLQIPPGCVQMPPVRLGLPVESFALPLLCRQATHMELRAVVPAGHKLVPSIGPAARDE
jgi:hypothetical protein